MPQLYHEEVEVTPESGNRSLAAFMGGGILSVVSGAVFAKFLPTKLITAEAGPDMFTYVIRENPLQSSAWWAVVLISFVVGFSLVWKYAFRPKGR
jgi:hypothetical protein